LYIQDMRYSPDGKLLALAVNKFRRGQPGARLTPEVTLWTVNEPGQRRSLPDPPSLSVGALAFTADGAYLTAVGKEVKVWAVASGAMHRSWKLPPVQETDASTNRFRSPTVGSVRFAFSDDGRRVATLVSGLKNGSAPESYPIRVFDVVTGSQVREVPVPKKETSFDFKLSPSGDALAVGSLAQSIMLWDLRNPNSKPHALPFSGRSLLFSPDGSTLAGLGREE
jgi:WD40 repeat protein